MAGIRDGERQPLVSADGQVTRDGARYCGPSGSRGMKALAAALLAAGAASAAVDASALDVDALWDYGRPEVSEQRFSAALAGASADERLVLQTQMARSHGLRRDFAKARQILALVEPELPGASPEVRVRYQLELGRSFASARHRSAEITPDDLERARGAFMHAHELAAAARLDALAIDALHMMVFVDTGPDLQLRWNRKAVAYMEGSDQPAARRWEGPLRNNIGHALRMQGEHDAAVAEFRLSRAAYQRDGRTRNVRIADWMIARTYRDQQRFDDAIAIQLELESAWDADGAPDPYVYEELEILYRALGDETRAQSYRRKLHATRR